ncbi:MAG TPA: efflux RND transporter periplasmic adaptor subunit [Desulfomonilaceae bacterium]|nr:efflux RND transporter periplasmic adaptor subunit [Desulfomonilaceae bacterium]
MFGSRLILFLMPLVLFVTGCSQRQEKKPPPPPMKVGVVTISKGNIEQTLDVSGTISFIANTTVSSEVSAQVVSIEVADGQLIKAGQLLLVFDEIKIKESANQALANLQKDEATLSFNKTEWEKNLELLKTHSISQTQYDQKLSAYQNSLAQVEADKAVLAKANQDLNKTKVNSPIAGVLSNRYIEKGDWVSEGGKLFQISDYSKVYLEAFLSDLDVGKLNVKRIITEGVDADITIDSYSGSVFKGKLTYIQPVANQGRLFQIRIYLDNADMKLLQGMFGRGRTVVKVIPEVLRIPLDGLLEQVRDNDNNTVFLMNGDKKASLTRIKIGNTDPRYAQVTEGLNAGDVVVVQGKEILSSGQLLEPTDMTKSATASAGTFQPKAQ